MIERQEIECHACERFVRFDLDTSLNGNHVLHCPNCGHEHCRVVKDGKITDVRWSQRNGPTYAITNATLTTIGTTSTATSTGGYYLASLWLSTTCTT